LRDIRNWPGPDLQVAQIYVRRATAYHRKADVIPTEILAMLRAALGHKPTFMQTNIGRECASNKATRATARRKRD
jgi:hypothetical protein